jgi:hypothetical protein
VAYFNSLLFYKVTCWYMCLPVYECSVLCRQYRTVSQMHNKLIFFTLTLNPLTWRIWWAPNNASRWQMGFNSVFKGLTRIVCNVTYHMLEMMLAVTFSVLRHASYLANRLLNTVPSSFLQNCWYGVLVMSSSFALCLGLVLSWTSYMLWLNYSVA